MNHSIRVPTRSLTLFVTFMGLVALSTAVPAAQTIDFNASIRPLLSENCFKCHGPDDQERKGGKHGLRLDTPDGARVDLGGYAAIVPGDPDRSELVKRVTTTDADDLMPPPQSGKRLTAEQIEQLRQWIAQGAPYAQHWSYVKPNRPPLPSVQHADWPANSIDHFILAELEREQLEPTPPEEPHAIARRVSLDLTGLPPSLEEVDAFVADTTPLAYERFVDQLLNKKSFGEHWARMWLDQARYADSSGYADDPPRTIWAYRDYVIRSFNHNKPFDLFTIEQIAGDLLEHPTEEQLVATAFHRNTLTNNEGGTNDEEYRNVAIVDRVNTTMAVWMGTTMACAQCHSHKYDPISQDEYFGLFAILNNTTDADRRDESPTLDLYSPQQLRQKEKWEKRVARLAQTVSTLTPQLAQAQQEWEADFRTELAWTPFRPETLSTESGATATLQEDGAIRVHRAADTDRYTLETTLNESTRLTALRLESIPDDTLPDKGAGYGGGNFVVSQILAGITPPESARMAGRYVRVQIPGGNQILSLAEVQVFGGDKNIALDAVASQSSTAYDGPAQLAIDGNTNGDYNAKSTTHTEISNDPWFELDLRTVRSIDRIVLWNRTDNSLQSRLNNFTVSLLDDDRAPVWKQTVNEFPNPDTELSLSGRRSISFAAAFADYSQKGFAPEQVLNNGDAAKGWAVGGAHQQPHQLTLIPVTPVDVPAGSTFTLAIEHLSKHKSHTLGHFRLTVASDDRAAQYARVPNSILSVLHKPGEERTDAERAAVQKHFLSITPHLESQRTELAQLRKRLGEQKPYTTVPVLQELTGDKRRKTHLQYRGNFLDTGKEISEGLPSAFPAPPPDAPRDRLTLAHWLVSPDNPLTARVLVNRFWESIFGIGLVRTSEEFGSQGEPPSHPQLLDWLATEFMASGWNTKHLLKLMVTSSAYRQSSRVTPDLEARDPDNRLLARGPRFRLSAEMIRDQALFVSGLLSGKMHGPPVNPPQPQIGLSAAFGGGIDWKTSSGEDRYRRALYTTWRRSNPYPSMATFDAPSREVCTVRRERTNTPLQALVTLNDPVYVEAAQALARRMASGGLTPADKARFGFRLCLARPPADEELDRLVRLYESAYERFAGEPENARTIATDPIGDAPDGADVVELAGWTVVGNVLLNLDEMLMKR